MKTNGKPVKKSGKTFYAEIDEALKSWEEYKPYHRYTVSWIADRICWCWKFRLISENEMESLTERTTELFNQGFM